MCVAVIIEADFCALYINAEIDAHYMDGVAAFSSGHICVGTSVGIVAVINSPTPDGERMSLQQPLPTKAGQAVTAVATGLATMVAGNELGDIFMFDYAGDVFEQVWVFPGVGYPCTSLGMHGDVIAAGYSSGHIRLYRSSVREMAIEITAHARIINAIKIHPTLNMFVSCGDDQFVNVWSLPDFQSVSSKDSELLYSERIPNRLLTGISFFDDDKIGLVSYDEDDLIMLTRSG